MLEGKNLTYIRHEKIEGTSAKTGLPYAFANITLSDGLESFKLDLRTELAPNLTHLRKGDKVEIVVDVTEQFNRTSFIVGQVQKATQKAV